MMEEEEQVLEIIENENLETRFKIYNGDFFEEIKNVYDEEVNCVITDPPYNLQGNQIIDFKDEQGNLTRSSRSNIYDDWDNEDEDFEGYDSEEEAEEDAANYEDDEDEDK